MKIVKKLLLLCLFALAISPSIAHAQAPSAATAKPTAPNKDGKDGKWEDADMGSMTLRGESYESTTMVTAAYAFIWLAVLAFVTSVWMQSSQVERDMATLARRIAKHAPPDAEPATSQSGQIGKAGKD